MKNTGKEATASRRKSGFTLVELTIVLLLVAILSTMTVTFSNLVGKQTTAAKKDYAFLEQCTDLKTKVTNYVYEQKEITITDQKLKKKDFAEDYTEIRSVTFDYSREYATLLKCTAESTGGRTQTFVIYLRATTVTGVTEVKDDE